MKISDKGVNLIQILAILIGLIKVGFTELTLRSVFLFLVLLSTVVVSIIAKNMEKK